MRIVEMARLKLRSLLRRAQVERELDDELRFHLEMQTEQNLRAGMSPEEARRQAAIAFGGVEGHREAVRDVHWLSAITALSLDARLGVRMLRKFPGLTVSAVVGMAVAIAIGAGSFEVIYTMMDGDLPLDEGDRVVTIQQWDAAIGNPERRILADFAAWREQVTTVTELGAYRDAGHNLIGADGSAAPISVAEMTASGFRLTRVPPLLGRPLVEEDERPGAAPVLVIGHDVWRNRFGGDPAVVGSTVQVGRTPHTVVGVMPPGFGFPVNHGYWMPLRLGPQELVPRRGPGAIVFGRLAPGATLRSAGAEMEAIGRRAARATPDTHRLLSPQVMPYTHPFADLDSPGTGLLLHLLQLFISLLLVVVAVNVAILVYARTATRMGEIVVRTALGASRRRIVTQLFVEALVLATVAAAIGLLLVWLALRYVDSAFTNPPFWLDFSLSPGTVLYALGLAVVGAVISGGVPALKATGDRLESSLRSLGGSTGMRMGRTWTLLIVAQVAVAVAVLPVAIALGWAEFRPGMAGPDGRAAEMLTARLSLGDDDPGVEEEGGRAARAADRHAELLRRLEDEPAVAEVTFASRLPGVEYSATVEVEDPRPSAEPARHEIRFLQVDPGFLDVFGATVLAGRPFGSADQGGGEATAVIADRTFVRNVLGGGPALGRRFRYTRTEDRLEPGGLEHGEWYEVVGVVSDLDAGEAESGWSPGTLYHPAAVGELNAVSLVMRVQGAAPESFAARLRAITAAVDPTLRVSQVLSLEQIDQQGQQARRMVALALAVVTLSVLLLSAAGIHALMSFTVARRRREIGIRTALGAHPRRIMTGVFGQAARQLGLGLAVGLAGAALVDRLSGGMLFMNTERVVLLPAMAAVMMTVGLLAALGPARRGLRIQPMEALREE